MSTQRKSSLKKTRKGKQPQQQPSVQPNPVHSPPPQAPPVYRDPAYYYPQMVPQDQPYYHQQTQMYQPQPFHPQQSNFYQQSQPFHPSNSATRPTILSPQPPIWQMRQQASTDSDFEPFTGAQSESVPETQFQTQSPSESEPHSIPETQPDEVENQTRRKGKSANIPWDEGEERVLGRSFVDISEDAVVGKSQKREFFWNRVTKRFLKERNLGNYRKKDAIATKFRNMSKYAHVFNGYYMDVKRSWGSGLNDTDIISKAHTMYADEQKKKFTYQGFWEEVRGCSKWQELKEAEEYMGGGSKRSKISDNAYTTSGSEAHFGIDLNDDDDDEEAEVTERMIGRDKATRLKRGVSHNVRGGTSDSLNNVATAISGLKTHLTDFKGFAYEKQKTRDMKVLMKNISDLTGDDLQTALKIKADIKKKYNL